MATVATIPDPSALGETPPSPATLSPSNLLQLESEVVEWTDRLHEQATGDRDREKEIRETTRIINYLEGKHWTDKVRYGRQRPVLNKTRRHFWDNVGLLTDLAIDFQVKLFDKLNDYCYDSKTEILTRDRGFVLFKDLLSDDFVATRSRSGEFEWQRPTVLVSKQYSGPMYHFKSKCIDIVVTPAHRMLVATAPTKAKQDHDWVEKIVSAEEFADGLHNGRKIPQTSTWTGVEVGSMMFPRTKKSGKDFTVSGDDFCALLGSYIAEGSMMKIGGIGVSQTVSSKGYPEFKELFDRIGGWYDGRQFRLSLRAVNQYFRQFGVAHEKFVPEVVRNATPRQIKIFLHYYALGDGHFVRRQCKSGRKGRPDISVNYTTVSRRLADNLVELIQKIGISASVTPRPPYRQKFIIHGKTYECDCRESFAVIERYSKRMGPKAEKFQYDGTIHCVTVPNGIVYVRRDGNSTWCGNSSFEKMLNELAVHWAMKSRLEDRLYDVILYGLLHTGPSKIQWNSALAGGMGDNELLPIAPWQWAVMGAGTNPSDAECIQYFPVVTRDYLARRFGKALAGRVQYDMEYGGQLGGSFHRPGKISRETWSRMGEGLRMSLGIKRSATADDAVYPMALQKEFWLRDDSINERSHTVTVGPCDSRGEPTVNWAYRAEPGESLYPRGRVIVTAGGCVLEDTCNPYWHARFPFPVFRPFRVPWKLSGDPMARPWMQMNNIVNRIMGGVLDMINAIVEPTLIGPKGAFPAADWDALDPGAAGGKIKYNNNAPRAPEFAKRSEIPGWVFSYLGEINKELEMTSGASAMQQALTKKQVPGGDSLEMILGARSLPVKVESKALASYIEDGGQMTIANMLQFYSAAHRVNILGASGLSSADYRPIYGEAIPQGMKPEDFVRKFQGTVRRDTLLQSEKDRKLQMAFVLLKMGKISDQMFFRMSDSNFDFSLNKSELLEEARLKLLVAAASAALTGKGQAGGKQRKQ